MAFLKYFLIAFISSIVIVPIVRKIAIKFQVIDIPHTDIKTHKDPTPYFGGIAIAIAFGITYILILYLNNFPRESFTPSIGILMGAFILFILGAIDDIKKDGIGFKLKFVIQIICAVILIIFDIKLHFIEPGWFGNIVTVVWVVGITNAFNIIDIMDGLSSGVACIASLAMLFIGIFGYADIYVSLVSIALVGACLGFLPYNFSKKYKIFMGDTGSLFIGFTLAAISLGVKYTQVNPLGLFAPLFIFAIPIYDTILVMILRWMKGTSPFLGSKDHFALRLEKIGYSRKTIVIICYAVSLFMGWCGYLMTRTDVYSAGTIFVIILTVSVVAGYQLSLIIIE